MKRKTAIALVIIVVLTGIFFRLFDRFLDTPERRVKLARGIQSVTGGRIIIRRLGLSLMPGFGVKASGIELTACPMLGKHTRVTADALKLRLDPKALVGGDLRIDRLVLESPVVEFGGTLEPGEYAAPTDPVEGRRSDEVKERPAFKEEPAPVSTPPDPTRSDPLTFSWAGFRSKSLEVTDGTFILGSNRNTPSSLLQNVNLMTGDFSQGDPVPFELNCKFRGTAVSAKGELGPFDSRFARISQSPLNMRLETGSVLSADGLRLLGIPEAAAEAVEISDVDVRVTRSQGAPSLFVEGSWHVACPRVLPGVRLLARGRSTYEPRKKLIELTELSIRSESSSGNVNIRGRAYSLDDRPEFELYVSVPPFRARDLLTEAGLLVPETEEQSGVLGVAELEAKIFGSPHLLQIRGASCRIDRTAAKLSLKYQTSETAPPTLDFDVHLNELDLDRYSGLEWAAKTAKKKTHDEASSLKAHASEPGELDPRDFMITRGRVSMERGRIGGVRFSELTATVRGGEGLIQIKPVTARLYEGLFEGAASIDLRGGAPFFEVRNSLDGIQAGPLTRDITGLEQMQGVVDMGYALRGRGSSVGDIRKSLSGKAWFQMEGGTLLGPSPLAVVRLVENVVRGSDSKQREEVPFSGLAGTFHIHRGRFYSEDFQLDGPVLRVSGQGSFGLNRTVDVKIKPTFLFPDLDHPSSALREGLSLPLRIYGTFRNASIRPDMEELDFRSVVQTLRRFLGRVND
jgi:uncharacterized protein involved in outer membrane biogenesis